MKVTPQEFKRVGVKEIIYRVLGEKKIRLLPISISVNESLNDDFTKTDFSFSVKEGEQSKTVALDSQRGKGFVDGLFAGLQKYFINDYKSLDKIRLADYNVNPIMANSKNSMGTDAQASVLLSVMVKPHGLSEFSHTSRSMIYSSFSAALEAFEFYINCDRSFYKIQSFIEDARRRNRGDVISSCIYDLSKLTEVNTYDKEKEI